MSQKRFRHHNERGTHQSQRDEDDDQRDGFGSAAIKQLKQSCQVPLTFCYPTMLLYKSLALFLVGAASTNVATAFAPCLSNTHSRTSPLKGYLDDLTNELNGPDANPTPEDESREANKMDKSQVDRAGPGSFEDFVDFNEFDGGDGQMGVAGDGTKGLEKMDSGVQIGIKSKQMSAKNAWGTSSGYADELLAKDPKIDTARAQQLENWANQQEVRAKNQQLKEMSEAFESEISSDEENWRQLAKFGVERNEEFDMDEEFGPVTPGDDIEGVIELKSPINKVATHEILVSLLYCFFYAILTVCLIFSYWVASLWYCR